MARMTWYEASKRFVRGKLIGPESQAPIATVVAIEYSRLEIRLRLETERGHRSAIVFTSDVQADVDQHGILNFTRGTRAYEIRPAGFDLFALTGS